MDLGGSDPLVELVSQQGKNWNNILISLHKEHKCPDISDSKKLRHKFNTINSSASAFRRPFKKTKFTAPRSDPTGKKLTKQEISVLDKNHEQAEEQRLKEHKETQDLLNKIQRDEIKSTKGRGKKRTIEEVQATLTAEELERKDKNKARIESARKEAAADRERQTLMLEVLKESVKTLKFTNMFMARLHSDVFPTQPFIPQNTCDNVASADCDE